jgi:hypothetical protein
VLLALLLATAAAAGELVRFRASDGSVGLVDHPSKVPHGAVVLDHESREDRPASADDAPAPQSRPRAAAIRSRTGASRRAPPAAPQSGSASTWCDRGTSAHAAVEQAEQRIEYEEERYDECDDGGILVACSRYRVEQAEEALEAAQQRLEQLEEACREAGCEPGWLRGDCH